MLFILWIFGCKVCGILVPQPGMEPTPPALEGKNLNHVTAGEVPGPVVNKGVK